MAAAPLAQLGSSRPLKAGWSALRLTELNHRAFLSLMIKLSPTRTGCGSETDQAGASLGATSESPGDGSCPGSATTCTVWASSASGRSLTLAFDSSGRLASANDGAGNAATYCYFGQSCAGSASDGGPRTCTRPKPPGG